MALTLGTGPWSDHPRGSSADPPPEHVLYLEPVPRRVQGELLGTTVLRSDRVQTLYETGAMPQWYLPRADVADGLLVRSETRSQCPYKGEATHWHLVVGDRRIDDAAWSYAEPGPQAPDGLAGLVAFGHAALDRWFEEDEELLGHPRDPYHRVDTRRSSRTLEVRAGGELVARSTRPVAVFETSLPTRWYLPRQDVTAPLVASPTTSVCPYKGVASYWSLPGHEDAAWSYEQPLGEALEARGMVSFLGDGIEVSVSG